MFRRRPRPIPTLDGDYDLNVYEVVATLPDETQVRIAAPADLEALAERLGDLPLLITPRAPASGIIPGVMLPVFTHSAVPGAPAPAYPHDTGSGVDAALPEELVADHEVGRSED